MCVCVCVCACVCVYVCVCVCMCLAGHLGVEVPSERERTLKKRNGEKGGLIWKLN